ncbi:MAG: M42 family metallopeptidase, partial [Gemmatimonadetes bacterium]|nr:M42 family metallopeptidase [Gemmatimonadota bacterium]
MSPDANHDISFLERLLDAPGPSGFESRPARVWRDEA